MSSTQGRGWTVFLVGESGSGKSRCLEELRTWALLEGWRVVEASCLPREDRSYGPYRRILDRADLLQPGQSAGSGESPSFRFEDFAGYLRSGSGRTVVRTGGGSVPGPGDPGGCQDCLPTVRRCCCCTIFIGPMRPRSRFLII